MTIHTEAPLSPLAELIDVHRQASDAFQILVKARGKMKPDDPAYDASEADEFEKSKAEDAATLALCAYPCRTLEEARIKGEYLAEAPGLRGGLEEDQVRFLLRSFAAGEPGGGTIPKPVVASEQPGHADAELLALGDEFERRWVVQKKLWDELSLMGTDQDLAIHNIVAPLAGRIAAMPAKTLDGLIVKARAVLWCHSGELEELGSATTDERIVWSIVPDLLAMTPATREAPLPFMSDDQFCTAHDRLNDALFVVKSLYWMLDPDIQPDTVESRMEDGRKIGLALEAMLDATLKDLAAVRTEWLRRYVRSVR